MTAPLQVRAGRYVRCRVLSGASCSPALLGGILAERVFPVGGQVQINPQVRLPRTFKRFCGLLVQLLQKLSIRATNGPDKLLKVCRLALLRIQPKLSTAHFNIRDNIRAQGCCTHPI